MITPAERVIMSIDGKEPDRVPVFSYYLDFGPAQDILGRSPMGSSRLMMNPVSGFFMNRLGKLMKRLLRYPIAGRRHK